MSKETDCLSLFFRAPGRPVAPDEEGIPEELTDVLEILEAHAGEWMPRLISSAKGPKRKYSRENLLKALALKKPFYPILTFHLLRKSPKVTVSFRLPVEIDPHWQISVTINPLSSFQEPEHVEERSRKLVDLMRAWASRFPPLYGHGHSLGDKPLEPPRPLEPGEDIYDVKYGQLAEIYWLNLLGKKMVESVGRERVLSTPAHLVEELPGGTVLILTRPTVADVLSDEARVAQARAHVHLRPDLRFDDVLAKLRAQSAEFVPVEPRFDPDIADLVERVLDVSTGVHNRQRKVREFNAWRPPPVDEWLPRQAALPSDVPNPAATIRHYGDKAEGLVAIMHGQVDSLFNNDPASLTDLDLHMWQNDYPGRTDSLQRLEGLFIPIVGAYLGEVLVDHLGGQWIPRRNLLEAQVLVGERAWLPFLRAKHYIQSKQAALDYSLTKFYREAARHRGTSPLS